VVVEALPSIWLDKESKKVVVQDYARLHFTNFGTREVVVSKVELTIGQPLSENADTCSPSTTGEPVALLPLSWKPFVVKSGEINTQIILPMGGNPRWFGLVPTNYGKDKILIAPCLKLAFVTADNTLRTTSVALSKIVELEKSMPDVLGLPIQIYHKWGSILSN
jgi:hypothetical protein